MFKKIILLLGISAGYQSVSQTPALSPYEKRWALFHPAAAFKARKISRKVSPLYTDTLVSNRLDQYTSGGQLDAFRHVFYMAAFAQKIKPAKIRKLGVAHEKANHEQFKRGGKEEGEVPDSLSSVMDLANNELGIMIGSSNKNMALDQLRLLVIDRIRRGDALILKRNSKGKYVDCLNREIPAHLLRQWNVPKCLVPSSEVYAD